MEGNDWARRWAEKATMEDVIKLAIEWNDLKQRLCAETLHVPTGTDDWIERAIRTAKWLYKYREGFNRLASLIKGRFLEEVRSIELHTYDVVCENCAGKKRTGGHLCVVCRGVGVNPKYANLLKKSPNL